MRRSWVAVLGTCLVAGPAAAVAQARSCDLVEPADFRQIVNSRGEEIIYFRDPVRLHCTGGVTVQADSAIFNRTVGEIELIERVLYRDSTQQLTSRWARYLGRQEVLLARRDVVLTNLHDGSVVTGHELEYHRQTASRPTSRMVIQGGRPHAVLERTPDRSGPPGDGATGTEPGGPVDIRADRLEFIGETLFLARGDVEIQRGGMTGTADSARYDQAVDRMTLRGHARVQDERYRLEGETVDAHLAGDELREVWAEERAMLQSEDLTVRSRLLRIRFIEGELDRLEAWNPTPGDHAERAAAFADDFRLQADSIDARAPGGRLQEVRAVRRAYGERRVDAEPAGLPPLIARDWIQGDTIIGYFAAPAADTAAGRVAGATTPADAANGSDSAAAPRAPAPQDTGGVVLERVVVIGGQAPALSLYRMQPEREGQRGAINFMKARRIVLFMTDGEVERVEAEGPIEGVHLDPSTRGTTEADTRPPGTREGR